MSEHTEKKQGLRANFVYNFISQILTLIIPFITTPYLARVLTETGNGQISYATSIVSYFTLFAALGFDTYGQRQIAACRDDKKKKSGIFWSIVILKIFCMLISVAVFIPVLFTVGFGDSYDRLILFLGIQIVAVPFDIQFFFRGEENFRSIAIRTVILRLAGLVCIFVFVKDISDTWVYALCISVSTVAANLSIWPSVFKRIERPNKAYISFKPHIRPALIIFLPLVATTVYSVFDKTMIGLLAENADYENGCYEQAYKINSVALLLVTIISPVMMSRNANDYKKGDLESVSRHLMLASKYVWMMGIPLIVGFSVMSWNLSSWYLGDGYAAVPYLLIIMSVRFISSGFAEVFGTQLFMAIGKEHYSLIASLIAAVVNVVLNIFLIQLWGAIGAATATAICEITVTAVLAIFAYRLHIVSFGKILLSSWRYILSAAIMFVPLFFMQRALGNAVWSFFVILIAGIVIYGLALWILRDKFFIENAKKLPAFIAGKLKIRKKADDKTEPREGSNMFDNMTEEDARAKIKDAVADYWRKFKKNDGGFREGDRITYAARVYDEKEMCALTDATLDFWLTTGRFAERFEKEFSEWLGVKYAHLVNSGSSANLIAFSVLTAPELGERRIKRGDEVITVACGFPTTVTPILQYGAVPVFVDVTIPQYNIDVSALENAFSKKTKAVMIAHTLGNPFDLAAVTEFCRRHGLWLIEDNCDALGSEYTIDGETRYTGTWGDIGTSSFYPPHHMTMGEGGCVYTNNALLHRLILSYRDWGRDCICPSGKDNFCGHRFDGRFGQLPAGYDHKYVYSHFGYNLKVTDMQAAVGCEQLKKFPSFIERRRHNWARLRSALECCSDKLILPEPAPGSEPSWFGFVLTMREGSGLERNKITGYIEEHNIQTRLLFSGNLTRHPCFDDIRGSDAYRIVGTLDNTDRVMNDTFWIGVYPGMTDEMTDYMAKIIKEAIGN